jgi:hypothetical protein
VWLQTCEQRAPVLSRATTTTGLEPLSGASASPPSTLWQRVMGAVSNPPLAATLTGLVIGLVRPLRDLFFNAAGDALLQNTLWVTMRSVGDLTLPLQLIMLGASVLEKGDAPSKAAAPAPALPPLSRAPSLKRLLSRRASHVHAVAIAAAAASVSAPSPALSAHDVYGERSINTAEANENAPPSPLGDALPGIHIGACDESDAGANEDEADAEDDFEFPINFEEAQSMSASLPIDWRDEARIMTVARSLVWHRDSGGCDDGADDSFSASPDRGGGAAKPTLRRRNRPVPNDDDDCDDADDDATTSSVSFHADTRPMTSPKAYVVPQWLAAVPPLARPTSAASDSQQLSGAAAQEAVVAAAVAPSPARLTIAVDAAPLDDGQHDRQLHGTRAPPTPLKSPTSPTTSGARLYRDALMGRARVSVAHRGGDAAHSPSADAAGRPRTGLRGAGGRRRFARPLGAAARAADRERHSAGAQSGAHVHDGGQRRARVRVAAIRAPRRAAAVFDVLVGRLYVVYPIDGSHAYLSYYINVECGHSAIVR